MMIKSLSLIVLLTATSMAHAENHLLVIGGGGEPARDTTIFDNGMENLGKSLEKANWRYEVSFNGGHADTEKILKKHYPNPSAPTTNFTQEKYAQLIEGYKKKILSGEIKSGDQLMIIVNTHGASKSAGQLTHRVSASGGAATDLNELAGSKLVSLDDLQEIVKLTNDRGIKLGIVDLSCHSGNTLALKKNAPNTCIVTASGPVHYGFAGSVAFPDKFLAALKPGKNLEEVFLEARLNSSDSGYPMISTSENDKIVNDVYNNITPYLYYYSPSADKMTPYVLANANQEQMCRRDEEFKDLMSKLDELKSVMKSKKNSFNADKLIDLLNKYKASQDKVLKATMVLGTYKLDNVENFPVPANSSYVLSNFKIKYTWKELIALDVDDSIATFEKFKKFSESKKGKDDNQAVIDFLKLVRTKKQQILTQNPQLKNVKKETEEIVKQIDKSYAMANKIALQEKVYYEELYRRSQTNNSNDPCKKIVF